MPINCGKPPEAAHATHQGSTYFGGELTYTSKMGWHFEGGADTATVKCQKDGKYSKLPKQERVSCGPAPQVLHAGEGVLTSAAPPAAPTALQLPRKGRDTPALRANAPA